MVGVRHDLSIQLSIYVTRLGVIQRDQKRTKVELTWLNVTLSDQELRYLGPGVGTISPSTVVQCGTLARHLPPIRISSLNDGGRPGVMTARSSGV